jgi:twitching motility two-component system response regulator PilH
MVATGPLRRVLLVNDSPDEREMYAEWFRRQGCSTLQAENADDAYRMAVELTPEVVITDVKLLGKEDGLALTQRLKRDSHTRDVTVVILSGYVFKTDDEAARRAGCDLVLHKPCLPDALANAVDRLLVGP